MKELSTVVFAFFTLLSGGVRLAGAAPSLPTADFPIGAVFGPSNTQTEFTNATNARFNVASPLFSPNITPSVVNAMLSLAASNSMTGAVWDTEFATVILGPTSSSGVTQAADKLYSRYGTRTALGYWFIADEPSKKKCC